MFLKRFIPGVWECDDQGIRGLVMVVVVVVDVWCSLVFSSSLTLFSLLLISSSSS